MPAGAASEAARSEKKKLLAMEKWTHTKNHKKKMKKLRIFEKHQKNADLVARAALESIRKEGSGRGPESDLVEDSMFF